MRSKGPIGVAIPTAPTTAFCANLRLRSPVSRLSSEMTEPMRQILDKTEVGRLTPPEASQSGVELFAVCAKREVKGESSKKRDVKDQLANTQFQAESKKLLAELRKTTLIQYR